ncbi:endoplasmic reticulum retention protein [Saitoella coloradoensis]
MSSANNILRYTADGLHALSLAILITTIHLRHSASGISLKSRVLYLLVYLTRYVNPWLFSSGYLAGWKIAYIFAGSWIIGAMYWWRRSWKGYEDAVRVRWLLLGTLLLSVAVTDWTVGLAPFFEFTWTWSIILESIAIVPQLIMLMRTSIPTVINSYYLTALGLYRFFYCLNWIYRYYTVHYFDWRSVVFGTLQTLLYIDFGVVWWRRQRVVLDGNVVQESDFTRGVLLNWLFMNRYMVGDGKDVELPEYRGDSVFVRANSGEEETSWNEEDRGGGDEEHMTAEENGRTLLDKQ